MIEKFLYLSDLFDTYGILLTEKQRLCLKMSLYEDFSLSEIAAELNISRQAVFDNIHRSEAIMKNYEEKLQIIAKKKKLKDQILNISKEILALGNGNLKEDKQRIYKELMAIIKREDLN